jgi:hypothetical protein
MPQWTDTWIQPNEKQDNFKDWSVKITQLKSKETKVTEKFNQHTRVVGHHQIFK